MQPARRCIVWAGYGPEPILMYRPVSAHNGAVAIAVPVEGIVVDGDLSD